MLAGATDEASESILYDDFGSDQIDDRLWTYLTLPQAGDADWICFDPSAVTQVGEGTLDIYVERFAPSRSRVHVLDNLKHQLVSKKQFSTQNSAIAFALDMAATNVGETPTDYRDGFASFTLFDTNTGWSFRACCNGSKNFALYDPSRRDYQSRMSTNVIDAPSPATRAVGNSRRHEVTVSGREQLLEWRVDGELAYRMTDADIPPRLHIALGLATLRSVDQLTAPGWGIKAGLSVSFGPVSIWSHSPS